MISRRLPARSEPIARIFGGISIGFEIDPCESVADRVAQVVFGNAVLEG